MNGRIKLSSFGCCVLSEDSPVATTNIPESSLSQKDRVSLASLMSASSDMLRALEYYFESSGSEPSKSVFERMAKHAISKAKGEQ